VPPELGAINISAAKPQAKYADDHWMSQVLVRGSRADPAIPEVHTYTDQMSLRSRRCG